MSDEALRALERAWRALRSREAEVALLRERIRVGALDPARLALAACLGHEAARATSDPSAPTHDAFSRDWFTSLRAFDAEAQARLALGAARACEHAFRATFPKDGRVAAALLCAELALLCPCAAHGEAFHTAIAQVTDAVRDRRRQADFHRAAREAGRSTHAAVEAVALATGVGIIDWSERSRQAAVVALGSAMSVGVTRDGRCPPEWLERCLAALREEVAPWAVGHEDSLRARRRGAG